MLTGVCRGIPIFLIFAPKHRLLVLIRAASPIFVLSKNIKNIYKKNPMKFSILVSEKISVYCMGKFLLHGQVFAMNRKFTFA